MTDRVALLRRGRRVGVGALLAGLALAAAACSSSGSPASSASGSSSAGAVNVSGVTLNIGDQAGAGAQALLTAAGLINKLPFKAHFADFTSGPPMLQAMNGGSIDVGSVGDAPPVFATSGGGQLDLIGATVNDPSSGALLVGKNSGITSAADLKGKTVAVAQGSSANYHLLAYLEKNGLTIKDIKVDYLQPAEAQAAFASGHVAAWDVWSPYIEEAEVQDGATVLADWAPVGKAYSFVVASKSAVANAAKAAAIKDYLKLLFQAQTWANKNQAAWAKIWGKATGMSTTIMTKAAADDQQVPVAISAGVVSSETQVASAFYAAGLIPAKVDFSSYSTTAFNSVLAGASG